MDIQTLKKISEALLPLVDINEQWEKSWLAVKDHLEKNNGK
jgi:hypothetical protein